MLTRIFLVLTFLPCVSFARGPQLSSEQKAALAECGIEKPAQRLSREERQAHREQIQSCFSSAGIEMPERPQRRGRRGGKNSSINE